MTPEQRELKQRLEQPQRSNEWNGTMAQGNTEAQIMGGAKRAIAHALLQYHLRDLAEPLEQASLFLDETGVVLLEGPADEHETLPLLQNNQIEYPDFYRGLQDVPGLPRMQNRLDRLFCIWTVKGYHKKDPDTFVEMLIGGYEHSLLPLAPLGKRSGYHWVSPASPISSRDH